MTQGMRVVCASAFAGALALTTTTGCTRAVASVGRADHDDRLVLVTVRNHFQSEVRVYVAAGGTRHRLGAVEAGQVATFRLPRVLPLPTDVRLEAIPIGLRDPYVTEAVAIGAGQRLAFTVAPDVRFSTLVQWR